MPRWCAVQRAVMAMVMVVVVLPVVVMVLVMLMLMAMAVVMVLVMVMLPVMVVAMAVVVTVIAPASGGQCRVCARAAEGGCFLPRAAASGRGGRHRWRHRTIVPPTVGRT